MTLTEWCEKHDVSYAEFGRRIGVKRAYARRLVLGEQPVSRRMIPRILEVTAGEVHVTELIQDLLQMQTAAPDDSDIPID